MLAIKILLSEVTRHGKAFFLHIKTDWRPVHIEIDEQRAICNHPPFNLRYCGSFFSLSRPPFLSRKYFFLFTLKQIYFYWINFEAAHSSTGKHERMGTTSTAVRLSTGAACRRRFVILSFCYVSVSRVLSFSEKLSENWEKAAREKRSMTSCLPGPSFVTTLNAAYPVKIRSSSFLSLSLSPFSLSQDAFPKLFLSQSKQEKNVLQLTRHAHLPLSQELSFACVCLL